MTKVIVSGWKRGFEKVKFTGLLQASLGYSLSGAKQLTDVVLDGGMIELQVPDSAAEQILSAIDGLGVEYSAAMSASAR